MSYGSNPPQLTEQAIGTIITVAIILALVAMLMLTTIGAAGSNPPACPAAAHYPPGQPLTVCTAARPCTIVIVFCNRGLQP